MMNTQQRSYALSRVSAIASRKIRELTDKHTVAAKPVGEVLAAFRRGEVPVRDVRDIDGGYRYLRDMFDLSAFDAKVDKDAIAKDSAKVHAEADRIRDQIMLGDAEEALELLKSFDKAGGL